MMQAPPYDPTLADPGSRLAARIIDTIAGFGVFAVAFVIDLIAHEAVDPAHGVGAVIANAGAALAFVALLGGPFLYEWLLTALTGATLGKRIMRIRVVNMADRTLLTTGKAAGRAACVAGFSYVPVVSLLDALWLLGDKPLQRCLHDMPVTTVVVRSGYAARA